jgi:hypothetical protein
LTCCSGLFGALLLPRVIFQSARRGGTSFGIPPSQVGTLSATTALVEAQAGSNREAMAVNTARLDFMEATGHNQV